MCASLLSLSLSLSHCLSLSLALSRVLAIVFRFAFRICANRWAFLSFPRFFTIPSLQRRATPITDAKPPNRRLKKHERWRCRNERTNSDALMMMTRHKKKQNSTESIILTSFWPTRRRWSVAWSKYQDRRIERQATAKASFRVDRCMGTVGRRLAQKRS